MGKKKKQDLKWSQGMTTKGQNKEIFELMGLLDIHDYSGRYRAMHLPKQAE